MYDADVRRCYEVSDGGKFLVPATLEGCVMRISDIIAYLGKDRQDAVTAGILPADYRFESNYLGPHNAAMINNLIVDIVEQSYGKDYIAMSPDIFEGLKEAKKENYEVIYLNDTVKKTYDEQVAPMFAEVYERLREDLLKGDESSPVFTHHIDFINKNRALYNAPGEYLSEDPDYIVCDYIASMTDDYFLELYNYLFKEKGHSIRFRSYFD